ncbi:hypothetical protein [Candidatus Puniceispirillum marinum]|uniref:Curli production assembly/transport component CsgG n=1 Tax=Puniceispirillum marinum (strain IMCC1322) TaxID=488538 RepID=D5BUI1_PUNMI|nr:hypothetical protein [Candidatus Puniceispirillum marinum]ADE39928.1 hypothetical protein SAR116_1685 [Candidatus Puniceispirillum marinum IMCC1322]
MLKLFLLLTAIYMAVPNAAVARVEIVEVNVEGMGLTLGDAILDGLQSAVSMVNGVEVASQSRLEMATVSTETNQAESYTAASAFSKDITTATKGVVDGYDVLSSGRDASLGNNYVVQLAVRISKLKQSKQLNRLRMAVSGLYVDDNVSDRRAADATALAIQNAVVDYLTQTRRFAMIDRNNLADTQTELNYIATSGMATRELARLGNKVGTDYLVVMIMRELNTNIYQKKMKTNNRIKESKQVVGEISVRILDVATSQIKFSDTIVIRSEQDYRTLAKDGGRVIGQTIQNAIYPARIVAIDGDAVTIGQGGKTFVRNEIYELVQLGERMIDPYTKESLGFQEIPVGKIKIERVQSKQSTGRIIEIEVGDVTKLTGYKYIVRPLRSNTTATLEANRKNVKKAKNRIEEMKQSFN